MPPWAFVLVVLLVLCAIAAAIVVPLQFFVFKTLGNHEKSQSSADKCGEELDCKNGGTSVFSQGVCSCICTNGFTGSDCSVEGSEGCTTTNLVSTDSSSSINDVTLGKAIPRLIAGADGNFSVPLSGTEILAKINNGDISCREQNSLVTFDGRAMRIGGANSEISDVEDDDLGDATANAALNSRTVPTIPQEKNDVGIPTESEDANKLIHETSVTETALEPRSTATDFTVTEEILDFARVVVLYILQEQSSNSAEAAQSSLQRFFTQASGSNRRYDQVTEKDAQNVTIGGDNTLDLVDLVVDIGDGPVGNTTAKRSVLAAWFGESSGSGQVSRRGGSVFSRI